MKERPILFSAPMVRAILGGGKTQTRRIVKPQFAHDAVPAEMSAETAEGWQTIGHSGLWWCDAAGSAEDAIRCPYGIPGDRLWVREAFCPIYPQDPTYNGGEPIEYDYAATYKHGDRLGDSLGIKKVWKPSIHMPRAASRILLEVTGVRIERLSDISEKDCHAEGCSGGHGSIPGYGFNATSYEHYRHLWESINGTGSWVTNPWVWVVEFRRI